jgi:hypothetical protein
VIELSRQCRDGAGEISAVTHARRGKMNHLRKQAEDGMARAGNAKLDAAMSRALCPGRDC